MWDNFLFAVFPYIALTIGIAGTIYRYNTNRYSWSSQSSQFLENKTLFYGSVPWHYGMVIILVMHILVIIFPGVLLAWNGSTFRLYLLELSGLALGFLTLFGLIVLIYRRLTNSRIRVVTTSWDIVVLVVLAIQVLTGVINAIFYRWGSSWYAATAVPWIWSILTFRPDPSMIATLPVNTKIHIFNAMLIIGLIPFTRFVHFLAFIGPLKYINRSYQLVRWYNRNPKTEAIRQYK